MKAMVTGGTGFVGSHLVDVLHGGGHDVTALIRSPAKAARIVEMGVRTARGDLDDQAALEAACDGRDSVFHVAGLVAARSEKEFLRVNRDGTRNVVAAASRARVSRFVLVSSMAAAGPSRPGRPLSGDEARSPVTAYGRSKLAAEDVVRDSGLEWTILRPPMVYGPRDTEVLRVFKIARGGIVPVFGSGRQELSAVYATDLAEALVAAAVNAAAAGKTYYACHPETFTSEEFARKAGRALGRDVRIVSLPAGLARGLLAVTGGLARLAGRTTVLDRDKANELLAAAWTGDPAPLMRETGWRADHDLDSGVEATVAWCQASGWL
jgi:nucleoside-diphosphate-sugar epimerase